MHSLLKDVMVSLGMGMVVPGILLNFAVALLEGEPQLPVLAEEISLEESAPSEDTAAPEAVVLPMRLRKNDGTTEEMDMDTYLVGVVLAEMPAYFEEEALKAQSVVARTYTRKAYVTGGKHGDGSICTKSSCCQAYITESDYLSQGGTQENVDKIRAAVLATSGYVLTYEGQLIEATYFSCSGGSTEDAVAVWGTDFPYLRAVSSPGEEDATYYTDTISFTREQLESALDVSLSGSSDSWFSGLTYTAGGGIDSATIGGQVFGGTQLRSLLGLRSTAFSVMPGENCVTITTQGFGHRVGMSQYGADAMAASGSTYPEILQHYYQGTTLEQVKN